MALLVQRLEATMLTDMFSCWGKVGSVSDDSIPHALSYSIVRFVSMIGFRSQTFGANNNTTRCLEVIA